MANEISLLISADVRNGSFRDSFKPAVQKIDQAAIGKGGGVQIIGTSEEVIVFGDVATEGLMMLTNTDAANFVEYGPESAAAMVPCCTLLAGESAVMRLKSGVVWRAQADTASVKLDVTVWEA